MFEQYDYLSARVIESDEVLSKYESDLYNRSQYIRNLLVNTNPFTKAIHPLRLIRTVSENRRLKKIKDSYYEIKNSSLPENFIEETGELDHDFYVAATYYKPKRMREFVKQNPIHRELKLLQKKR
jgi:hypothetical protein